MSFHATCKPTRSVCARRHSHSRSSLHSPGLRCVCCAALDDPYAILQVDRGASRRQVRAAYVALIRQLHPDVNDSADATARAAALNAAYENLMTADEVEGLPDEGLDAFDVCDTPPIVLFINPFATNANPLLWEELQAAAKGAADPLDALQAAGVGASESAVCYLTQEQRDALVNELERMRGTWAVDAAAFYVSDCLARARVTNARVQ